MKPGRLLVDGLLVLLLVVALLMGAGCANLPSTPTAGVSSSVVAPATARQGLLYAQAVLAAGYGLVGDFTARRRLTPIEAREYVARLDEVRVMLDSGDILMQPGALNSAMQALLAIEASMKAQAEKK